MPTRKRKDVEKALLQKGMEQDDDDHHFFRKTVEGVTHLVTKTSHSMDDIGTITAKKMANQCCLQLREFWQLVDCPLTADEWDNRVRDRCPDGRNPFLLHG